MLSQLPAESLIDEARATARNVDELADEVRIDTCDEVIEIQVDITDRRSQLGGVVIPQAGRVEVVQIGPGLDKRAA